MTYHKYGLYLSLSLPRISGDILNYVKKEELCSKHGSGSVKTMLFPQIGLNLKTLASWQFVYRQGSGFIPLLWYRDVIKRIGLPHEEIMRSMDLHLFSFDFWNLPRLLSSANSGNDKTLFLSKDGAAHDILSLTPAVGNTKTRNSTQTKGTPQTKGIYSR